MYKNKVIVCIKIDGETLREETGGIVFIPNNKKFNVFIKNLDTEHMIIDSINLDTGNSYWFPLAVGYNESIELPLEFQSKKYNQLKINWKRIDKHIDLVFETSLSDNMFLDEEIVTVNDKKICTVCQKKFKSSFKFCPFDGNFLNIL